jgi:hypothetical protein
MRSGPAQATGEYCLTTNEAYTRQIAAQQDETGKAPEEVKYAILLEIETEGPVMKELADDPKYGRVQKQLGPGGTVVPDPEGRPFQQKGERGVVVVKRERVRGGDESNINYVVVSKTPSDPEDPIAKVNQRIRKITVIGTVPGVSL